MIDWSIIIGIVGGVVGLIGAGVSIATAHSRARKSTVDRQSTIIDDLAASYTRLTKANNILREGLNELQIEYAALKSMYDALQEQYTNVCAWAVKRGYRIPEQGDGQA
jgi:hypothetical protein